MNDSNIIAYVFFVLALLIGFYEIRRGLKHIKQPNKEYGFSFIIWNGGGINNGWLILIRGILIILTICFIVIFSIFK
jgi:hypothetical protein